MIKKWWFWSIVVFIVTEAIGIYLVVFHGIHPNREWEYMPFNQSDALGLITFPICLSMVPLMIRNMRMGGSIPRESERGKLFIRLANLFQIIGIATFGSCFLFEVYDYYFWTFSISMILFLIAGVLNTYVATIQSFTNAGQPPKRVRLLFLIVLLGLVTFMFLNLAKPLFLYLLGVFVLLMFVYSIIVKRYR